MKQETRDEITAWVRMGFYSEDTLREIFCEEMYAPGELDENDVTEAIRADLAKVRADQEEWPGETDCDRLDRVFEALNAKGIIALQNAGYTQSDGYDDVCQVFQDAGDQSAIRGYCFCHGQDLERAVRGAGLFLAFGPMDPEKEETDGPLVGAEIVTELETHGFKTRWNGTFNQRIFVEDLDWKKRIS